MSLRFCGAVCALSLTADAASSTRSIALSGKYLSAIYLDESLTALLIASSVIFTLWCASYLSRRPLKISIASSSVGSPTVTGWNLLSSAASFSIFFLYSLIVVAPIMKRIMSFAAITSSIAFLILSSKSPRYFVPATIDVKSSATIFLPFKSSGTSF